MPAAKPLFMIALLVFSAAAPCFAQNAPQKRSGEFVAEGSGSGPSAQEAEEAAKIAAVNALVESVLKRDTIYRDLLMTEAFKNDWFRSVESKQGASKRWDAKAVARVDEGVADALYYGRYSTTVGALLDQTEAAIAETEPLLADGGGRESNGDLSGAETAYRRAASKADEAFRLVAPIKDAVFFSTGKNRKAPELQAVVAALRASASDGLSRVKESQKRLAVDASYKNVLDLMQTIEDELKTLEAAADDLHPVAGAPRSYESERLAAARDQAKSALESLARRRALIKEREASFSLEMEYPRVRAKLLADRLDTLAARFRSTKSAAEGELFRRSTPVRAAVWAFNHAPADVAALGVTLPFGAAPGNGRVDGSEAPVRVDGRAEGAFSLGGGGIWCRTAAVYGAERLWGGAESAFLTQGVDVGFFGKGLFAVGFRWDWLRRTGDSYGKTVKAVALTLGTSGDSLGESRHVPLWTTTFSWELPSYDGFMLAREVNLGVESVLRPSGSLRLEASASSRARETPGSDFTYLASARLGLGFRLPVLRPVLWRLSYEAAYRSPLADGGVDWSGNAEGAFRFGMEYAF